MNSSKLLISKPLSCNLTYTIYKGLAKSSITVTGFRRTYPLVQPFTKPASRHFSTSPKQQLEYFAPPKNAPNIKLTPPAWPHYQSNEELLKSIQIAHRETRNWSDWVAMSTVRFLRWGTDLFTGYRHDDKKPYIMNERKWLVRFIFLETVAGVPGMVGGMLRHFRSLRKMKRDNGWIETLLEDAYNERMHLLTFLKMAEPGWFMKLMILGAQGVFSNGFFLAYLVNPKICHRFVGYLEEEAVMTYTYAIQDVEKGRLPTWTNLRAPDIAINYWQMPEGKQTMLDLLYYVRADEAKHREIHHTLGNLNQAEDPNPYASEYKDESKPHPTRGMKNLKATGWEREDVI